MGRRTGHSRRPIHGVLLLDKPKGLTSNDALLRVRKFFHAEKAGHTGTLDPLATGLLPICLGQTTKLTSHLIDSRKRYLAEVRFGARTTTGDTDGTVTETSDPIGLTTESLRVSLAAFIGASLQVPPMHSAIKVDGERLYKLARVGLEIDREAREIEIQSLALLSYADGVAHIDVTCSKGTFIRTLAEDWARSIGQAAHLQGLRRLEVGPFTTASLVSPAALEIASEQGLHALDALLLPSRIVLGGWRFVRVDAEQIVELDFGRTIRFPGHLPGAVAIEDSDGRLMGLGIISEHGGLQPNRWFGGI